MKVYQQSLAFNGDAFDVFTLFKDQAGVFFLDSSLHRASARFSYLGFDPIKTVDNLADLKKECKRYAIGRRKLVLAAGAVGYLGYDGTVRFGIYNTILTMDHQQRKLIISGFSKERIQVIAKRLAQKRVTHKKAPPTAHRLYFKSNFTKANYMKAVRRALEHIRRGDIYQINLSHQVRVKLRAWQHDVHPADIYKNLRAFSPSEFGAYFDDGQQVVLSASPERFLKLRNGLVQVKPMKGTRPRGKTKAEDEKLEKELKNSPKEIAELLMVTDLERNDLGRVCDYATIKVRELRTIERYKTVFQATSTIEGKLRRDCDLFDLLESTFPSGSVTGCPKIAAMNIINKLERGSRGLYTGALGYISFSGDMDFNVMIRTMFLEKNQISFHVGGGIVTDSKPLAEWQETWVKAGPLIQTLKQTL